MLVGDTLGGPVADRLRLDAEFGAKNRRAAETLGDFARGHGRHNLTEHLSACKNVFHAMGGLAVQSVGMPKPNKHPEFAKRLKAIRKVEGDISVNEAADRAGVARQLWYNWERGESLPRHGTTKAMAKVFNVSRDWIIDGDPDQVKHARYIQLVAALDEVSAEGASPPATGKTAPTSSREPSPT